MGGKLVPEAERAAVYETPLRMLGHSGDLLLLKRESPSTPPNYLIQRLSTGREASLTEFAHPQPQLAQVHKELITYTRSDGVALSAQLFLPSGYNPQRDGPRPCLMWA